MNKFKILLCLLLSLSLCACAEKEEDSKTLPVAETVETAAEAPSTYPVLNEAMSRNHTTPIDGCLVDWVELYNPGSETLDLSAFSIGKEGRDDSTALQGKLESGEYLVLTERELGFGLSKSGETLILQDSNGNTLDTLCLPALSGRESYTREGGVSETPTPGADNSAGADGINAPASELIISEVCTANTCGLNWENDYCDWVELYNSSDHSVNLGDYTLSDDRDELQLFELPDEVLGSGEYKILLLHESLAPFSLDASGEILYLSKNDEGICDVLDIPYIPADCSYGRQEGKNRYFSSSTPGRANSGGTESICSAPTVSVPSGWYEESFTVTLSGEGEIRYTLDGSLPTKHSALYEGESIQVDRSMSIRCRSFDGNRIPSGCTTVNYFFDALPLTLDVVKITMSSSDRYNYLNQDSIMKSAASIALYVNGVEQFSESCGISIQGSGSRIYEKSSYQIDFRSRYGKTELNYKLFDDLEQTEFTTIALRSGSQDQCAACMRDELISGLFAECSDSLMTFHYRAVSLYLNEEYRGVYYIRERCKPATIAYREDVSEDSVYIARSINGIELQSEYGKELFNLLNYIRTQDLSEQEHYETVCEKLDIESIIDYFIALMWTTNYDVNNIRFYRSDADGGRWKMILYDSDVAFYRSNYGWVRTVLQTYSGLLNCLMRNEEFKLQFSRRLGELLNGPLAEDRVIARIDDFESLIANDMIYNCKRYPAILTYDKWQYYVECLRSREGFGVKGWNQELIKQYLSYISLSNEQIAEIFGEEFVPVSP